MDRAKDSVQLLNQSGKRSTSPKQRSGLSISQNISLNRSAIARSNSLSEKHSLSDDKYPELANDGRVLSPTRLRRSSSYGPAMKKPIVSQTVEANVSPRGGAGFLKSMASKISLRSSGDPADLNSGKPHVCVILIHDPLALGYGNTMFIIPRDKVTEHHRHVFIAASRRCSVGNVFDNDVKFLRNRAVHLLCDDEKFLDFGENRWPIQRGIFKEYERKQTDNFNMGCIPPCQEFYIVISPV
jgi:hypothetical protein